jgi:hypothetical protein
LSSFVISFVFLFVLSLSLCPYTVTSLLRDVWLEGWINNRIRGNRVRVGVEEEFAALHGASAGWRDNNNNTNEW